MRRKTKKMLEVERQIHEPLEKALPLMVTESGLSGTANKLNISKATLGYWLLKLDIEIRRIAVRPGDVVRVERAE